MAARSVFKLLTKTCSYSFSPAYPPSLSTVTPEKTLRKHSRSCSHSPRRHYKSNQEHFLQARSVSKSLENLRELRNKDEEYEIKGGEDPTKSRNKFPPATDLTLRDPAKEFKDNYNTTQEMNEEGNPIYELAEGSRCEENYYDVNYYMRRLEVDKAKRLFLDLQPKNLKPFGSSHNFYLAESTKRPYRITYPTFTPPRSIEGPRKKKPDDIHFKDFSSYAGNQQPQPDETTKVSIGNSKQSEVSKMKYSTISSKKDKCANTQQHVKFKSTLFSKSSPTFIKDTGDFVGKQNDDEILEEQIGADYKLHKGMSGCQISNNRENLIRTISSKEALIQRLRNNLAETSRKYNTQRNTEDIVCEDYVTVKLGELQEECRKAKKCKPKKISFGRLPKLSPPDCACLEDLPLKQGKPLHRLKKRFEYKDAERNCPKVICDTPRADANYKIKPKKLPVLHPSECPCEESQMTDLVIKRLPKKKVPEPPRICKGCVGEECCPPRADGQIVVEKKILPPLEINHCPCVEEKPLRSVGLKRLHAKPIKEPEKICKMEVCDVTMRADHGLKVEKKVLPVLKGECQCVERPSMDEGQPLKRMKKVKYVEKPKECKEEVCDESIRADSKLKVGKKKLPLFVPQNCPCHEPERPSGSVKLKRLPKFVKKDKEKICPKAVCPPRADEGMVVKPKQLPILEAKDCPCIPTEMVDGPPLQKLVPKPVKEPLRVCKSFPECLTPRSDENFKVKSKKLPVLSPGSCPCVEPPQPLDVKPLPKLKPKPVTYTRHCVIIPKPCIEPRADENLKVKIKKLPKLEVPDCPCIEPPKPEVMKPLKRLKKMHVPEPPRVCKKDDYCDEIPRADEDDWMYWKRVEVKSADCEPAKKNSARSYSTIPRRSYSTRIRPEQDLFNSQYDIPRLPPSTFKKQASNVIIDIKPSAPLILTQKQLELNKNDSIETTLTRKNTRCSKSEPIDCVTFVIFKSNSLGVGKPLKEGSSEVSLGFNTLNRFISTCSSLCAVPKEERHLQPKNPIIPEREQFITPYPSDDEIEDTARKSRIYSRTRKEDGGDGRREVRNEAIVVCKEDAEEEKKDIEGKEKDEVICDKTEKKLSLWERIVNYFKARPNCPSPDEFKKMRLKEEAEKAAQAAGLCLYDPKELLRKSEKELPKVITADTVKEDCEK